MTKLTLPNPNTYLPNNKYAIQGYSSFNKGNYSHSIALFTKCISNQTSKETLKNLYISRCICLITIQDDKLALQDASYLVKNFESNEIGYLLSFIITMKTTPKTALKVYNLAKTFIC